MEKIFLFVILVLGISSCTSTKEKLQNEITEITDEGEFNGIIQVNFFGKQEFSFTHHSNHSGLLSVNRETPVRLASLSKLFTELVILRMKDENLIDFDNTISDYRKDFKPNFGDQVTIRHLLEMKSGLPRELDSENLSGVYLDDELKAGPFLDEITNVKLLFEPDSNMGYSNLNYWLLGAVIEEVTGMNVEDSFSFYLFKPLDMYSSGLSGNDIVPGYYKEKGSWKMDTDTYQGRYTSGGFYSSANDMKKLALALRRGNFLSPESMDYLLGEDQRIEVFGSLKSFSNMFILDLKNQFSVIALNNVGLPDLNKMTELQKGIYSIFGIRNDTRQGSNNRIQVIPVDSLSATVKLEQVMAQWIKAVQEEDEEALFSILEPVSVPGSFERTDATWGEIIKAKQSMENFRVAGYRWVENEIPKGIEVWFISDTEAKIGFLLIPSDEDRDIIANLMVKPVDTIWMEKQF